MNAIIQSIVKNTGVSEPVAIKAFVLMNEDLVSATLLCMMYMNIGGVISGPQIIGKRHLIEGLIELCKEINDDHFPC